MEAGTVSQLGEGPAARQERAWWRRARSHSWALQPLLLIFCKHVGAKYQSENKGNTFVGYTPLESIKTLSFATITNVIGSAVN